MFWWKILNFWLLVTLLLAIWFTFLFIMFFNFGQFVIWVELLMGYKVG
jgi:hypothetical protein